MSVLLRTQSRGIRFFLRLACFFGIALVACPPMSRPAQSTAQGGSSFNLRADVELVTAEVVVLDKSGKPVRNLKKEDFSLYEDGKQQEISIFEEIAGDAPRTAARIQVDDEDLGRGKTVLIIFDDSTITPIHLKSARDSAARFVREHMNPQDLFAVALFDVSLKIIQNLTHDRNKVLEAIARQASSSAESRQQQPASSIISSTVGVNLDAAASKTENLLRAIHVLNMSVERLKGQKSVLLYSESSFFNPSSIPTIYNNTLASAKKSNVVFYAIDPAGLSLGSGGSTGSNSTGSQLGGMTDGTNVFGGSGSSFSQQSLLRSLANNSGGTAIYNTNDYDSELDKLNRQLSNYYVLGFQSSNPKHNGAFRKLEIETDLKGITLKHRSGYQDRRPIDILASSKKEKPLLDAAASPEAATQLPLIFRAAYFYDTPQLARVMVSAKINVAKAELKKKGEQLSGDLNVMGIAYAEDGSVAARFSETLHLAADKDKEPDFRKLNIGYHNYFRLRPGKYRLKLVTSDEANNLGSMEQSLNVPTMPENGMAASSLILAERIQPLPHLIRELQTKLLDDSEPLIFSGMQISPSIENKVPVNSLVPVFFKLYNIGGPNRRNLVAKAKLIGEKGEEFALPDAISLDADTMSRMGDEAIVGLNLPFKDLSPGKYKLMVVASESGTSQSATAQMDLQFMPK
jgi:VWFA-related protein